MPTAGRLTAAVFFAALAWYATEVALEAMPSVYDRPGVAKWNAVIGFWGAWTVFKKLDGTLRQGLVLGLSAVVLISGTAALIHSSALTVDAAWRGQTGTLLITFEKVFATMGDIVLSFATAQQALTATVAGGLLIGAAATMMERRFG